MWQENVPFAEALIIASEKYASAIPFPVRPIVKKPPRILTPMSSDSAEYFHKRLRDKRLWFQNRGLTDETIDREMLGYDGKAFVIPVWSKDRKLMTLRFRRDDKVSEDGSKYWGMSGRNDVILYNESALSLVRDWGLVVICEGELDCLRLYQEGVPAISSTNGAAAFSPEMAEKIDEIKPRIVVVAYDQDEEGLPNSARVARLFGKRGRVVRWPLDFAKDVSELLGRISAEEFVVMIEQAEPPRTVKQFWNFMKSEMWR